MVILGFRSYRSPERSLGPNHNDRKPSSFRKNKMAVCGLVYVIVRNDKGVSIFFNPFTVFRKRFICFSVVKHS